MKKAVKKKLTMAVALIFYIGVSVVAVSASASYSYIFNGDEMPVEAPQSVLQTQVFYAEEAGGFLNPQDLYLAEDGKLYVADAGRNEILVMRTDGTVEKRITSFMWEGKTCTFAQPYGIHVTAEGHIFVADRKNNRVVVMDTNGNGLQVITSPDAGILADNFVFEPTKVTVDSTGRIFVVSAGFNMGLLEFSETGRFVSAMGASPVAVDIWDLFWKSIATKAMREKMVNFVPTEYNNVTVDKDGFLLVTTSAFEYWQYESGNIEPLRRLNAKGTDILSRVGDPAGDLGISVSTTSTSTYSGPSAIVDVCVLGYDNYAILDQKRGRVFAYNEDGELMYMFGGPGDYRGNLNNPVALAYDHGKYFVLDNDKRCIYQYQLTEYGRLFEQVSKARCEIDYETEEKLWREIIAKNSNCLLAMRGLGNAAYRKLDMETACAYFEKAGDRESYSKAYAFIRRDWIEHNLAFLLVAVVAISGCLYLVPRLIRKRIPADKGGFAQKIRYARYVSFHPMNGFWELKREKRGSLGGAAVIAAAAALSVTISSLFAGFIFNETDIERYNMLVEFAKMLLIVMLWCVSQWCVTSLLDGEGSFVDILRATGYAFAPMTPFLLIATVLSRVMIQSEGDFYGMLCIIACVWVSFLLVIGVQQTHNYSMLKTIITILITLIVILLIVFVAMLLLSILQQMRAFLSDVLDEFLLRI